MVLRRSTLPLLDHSGLDAGLAKASDQVWHLVQPPEFFKPQGMHHADAPLGLAQELEIAPESPCRHVRAMPQERIQMVLDKSPSRRQPTTLHVTMYLFACLELLLVAVAPTHP